MLDMKVIMVRMVMMEVTVVALFCSAIPSMLSCRVVMMRKNSS